MILGSFISDTESYNNAFESPGGFIMKKQIALLLALPLLLAGCGASVIAADEAIEKEMMLSYLYIGTVLPGRFAK